MNIREFINLRDKCPLCNANLETKFISGRKSILKIDNNRLHVKFTLKQMKNGAPDYQVIYSFGLDDNSVQVEFCTEWEHYNQVPMHLLSKFKEFYKNTEKTIYAFYNVCTSCYKYSCNSNGFKLDLKSLNIGALDILYESFTFSIPVEWSEYKMIRLDNYSYPNMYSNLLWWRSSTDDANDQSINESMENRILPHIPFISKEETTKRLKNLIIFS